MLAGHLAAEGEANALVPVGHEKYPGSKLPASKGAGQTSCLWLPLIVIPFDFCFSHVIFSALNEEKPLTVTILKLCCCVCAKPMPVHGVRVARYDRWHISTHEAAEAGAVFQVADAEGGAGVVFHGVWGRVREQAGG